MALVTGVSSDSTNDGSGASTDIEAPQLSNAVNDAIIIAVSQSLNNAASAAAINVTTPAGYTQILDTTDNELHTWIFWKQSTGSEVIPTVISDTVANWSAVTAIVTDVDWANGGVNQIVSNTAGGDHQSPDLTTAAVGSASAIICIHSLERQVQNGFRYPETRPETVKIAGSSTGAAEGIDNGTYLGYDFLTGRSVNFDGPFWEASANGDSIAANIEIVTFGNTRPLQSSVFLESPAGASSFVTNMGWCRTIVNRGQNLDGTAMATWTFDAAVDVDPATDQITITGHGMDESMIVYVSPTENSPPAGMSIGLFYWVRPVDANTIQLCAVNEDSDSSLDLYASGTTLLPTIDLTAVGSGVITLVEVRMLGASFGTLDIFAGNNGNSSNPGPAPGSYIGDNGYNQNWFGSYDRFSAAENMIGNTLSFEWDINGQGRIDRGILLLIDEDGDWMAWTLYLGGVSPNDTGPLVYSIEVGSPSVQALAYSSFGTFDASRVRDLVVAVKGNNSSTARFGGINSATSTINYSEALTVINGTDSTWTDLAELAQSYVSSVSQPSELQIVSTIPINIGDGTNPISFKDSEKSVAFPPLADGVTRFQNYRSSIGIQLNAGAVDNIEISNTQIGASRPFNLTVTADPAATVNLTGNIYVLPNATLDGDITYNRQVFVGGPGVVHNNATITNSSFTVGAEVGADNGMIDFGPGTDITNTSFELGEGVSTGHAIIITTPGTYSFTNLNFTGFGVDGSATAAVYNNSSGAVTINVSGGGVPTVRNGSGASTVVSASVPIEITVTDTAGVPISGARVYLREAGGGTVIINELTNASGIVTGSFSGSTPQAVEGWVRKASSSPYYKQFTLGGSINGSGYTTTALMVLDE